MSEKNYYEILGVDKKATADEIKKAYRKLVRKYHPDVNKAPDAAEKAAKINVAYEILQDKEKRAEYDAMLENPFAYQQQGQNGSAQDFSEFFRQYANQRQQAQAGGFDQGEPFGQADFRFEDIFSTFAAGGQSGYGRQQRSGPIRGEDQYAELAIDIAAAYHGASRSISLSVPTKTAEGKMHHETKTLNIKIPKGICQGQQIRLAKQGLPGYNGGENGDLYLSITFHESKQCYVKDGKDIYQTVNVAPWTAVLGGKITVATPDGKVNINLPANSQPGKTLRLKGKGIPCQPAGDIYVIINIQLPKADNNSDRQAWQNLAKHYESTS